MTGRVSQAFVLWTTLAAMLQGSSASDPVDWAALTVPEDPPLQYKGDGTYYGLGSDNQGACGYGPSAANSTSMPWSTGTALTVAINDDQYSGGITCGVCIKFRGTGTGIGTQPIPQTWQYALVTNRCPECAPGSIDLALNGNGRWQVQWVPIPCSVGSSTFSYHVVSPASNPYYFAFSVSNTRVPLKNVELETDGSWASLRRDVSNSWNANGGIYKCPLHIRLTSVLGDVVEDWVPSNQGGQGTGQFPVPAPDPAAAAAGVEPLTPEYPGITSGDSAPVPVHWNAPNGTWVMTTSSNPASPGTPVRLPSPQPASAEAFAEAGSGSTSASAATSDSSSPSPSQAQSPPLPPSSPSPSSQAPSNPSSSSSSTSSSSSSSSSGPDKASLPEWAQCGGTYRCTANCADAAYGDTLCGSGLSCVRLDSTFWQCRPPNQPFTSTAAAPSIESSGSPTDYESGSQSSSGGASAESDAGASSGSGTSESASSSSSGNGGAYDGSSGSASSSSSGAGASASASAGRKLLRW